MLNFFKKKPKKIIEDIAKTAANVVLPKEKQKVILGKMIKKTAGGRHAWYESNVGPIRKPIQ